MKYTIRDRECGWEIDTFNTYEEARQEIDRYEAADKADGTYTEDFYEIVDEAGNIVEEA